MRLFLFLLIIGILGYSVIILASKPSSIIPQQPLPSTTPSLTIDSDWTFVTSNVCGVSFPLPPKTAPYYYEDDPNKNIHRKSWDLSRKFWQLEEYDYGSVSDTERTSRVIFKEPDALGVGYVNGLVEVNCSPNLTNYTAETWLAKQESKQSQLDRTVASKREGGKWDRKVVIVTFGGDSFGDEEYYIFTTKKYGYVIRRVVGSTVERVQEVTETIFNNLRFLD